MVPFLNGFQWTQPAASIALQLRGTTGAVFEEAGGGYLHWQLPIPANPALSGVVLDWQAFFLDAAAASGITMTNGVEMVIE
jgi:hypothetical protein